MKKYLEKQATFNRTLSALFLLSKWRVTHNFIPEITKLLARLNISLNKPKQSDDIHQLAKGWQSVMPPDGQQYYKISGIKNDTAYVEIHLHCPLRDTGKVDSCYAFMNYDRTLMKEMGGRLTVLESQSNSGKNHCRLAIRRLNDQREDLVAAHLKEKIT
ncbi:MAG: hypothetical protein CMB99_01930 [Flavobacteriaceae bacterium]|nr:hypothetical protein [Flavobacteriaceae bacterium]|tara:strand:- start:34911 stop:35387 length:477 start_codon:yes stop_codon:yes gene_type:complete